MAARRPARAVPVHRQLTFSGNTGLPALSPDGSFIAYVAGAQAYRYGAQVAASGSGAKLLVQNRAGGRAIEIFAATLCTSLRWSPDGSELLVVADVPGQGRSAFVVPRLGGAARPIRRARYACWSPDGSEIATASESRKEILVTAKSTGRSRSIHLGGPFLWLRDFDWSPVGDRLLVVTSTGGRHELRTLRPDGSEQQTVLEDRALLLSPRWAPAGAAIYYLRSEAGAPADLMRVGIDPDTGRAAGPPALLADGLPAGAYFTVSRDGRCLLYTRELRSSNVWLASVDGSPRPAQVHTRQLTTGTSQVFGASLSPDGRRAALALTQASRSGIFVLPVEGGNLQQVAFLETFQANPVWSPDGRQIAFGARDEQGLRVWRVEVGAGVSRPFARTALSGDGEGPIAWAPGTRILYQRPGNRNYHLLDPTTEREVPLVQDEEGWVFLPQVAPDGKRVAVFWNRPPTRGTWVLDVEDSTSVQVLKGDLAPIGWSADGHWIYVAEMPRLESILPLLQRVPASGGPAEPLWALPFENIDSVSLTQDARRALCVVGKLTSDVWLIEDFDPAER